MRRRRDVPGFLSSTYNTTARRDRLGLKVEKETVARC